MVTVVEYINLIINNAQNVFSFIGQIPSLLSSVAFGIPVPLFTVLGVIFTVVLAVRIITIVL